MNLMCLPFALVVSTISATTVFRRVIVAPDAWASSGPSSRANPRFGSTTGASIPRFARPKRSRGSEIQTGYELSTVGGASNTLPPLSEWDEDGALSDFPTKPTAEDVEARPIDVMVAERRRSVIEAPVRVRSSILMPCANAGYRPGIHQCRDRISVKRVRHSRSAADYMPAEHCIITTFSIYCLAYKFRLNQPAKCASRLFHILQ
jgi:hypothetical protein